MKFRADVRATNPHPFSHLLAALVRLPLFFSTFLFYFLCLSRSGRRGEAWKYSRMHKDVKYGRMNQLVFLRSERVRRRVWQYPRGGILRGLAPQGFMGHFVYAQTGQGCPSIHTRRDMDARVWARVSVCETRLCIAMHNTRLNSFGIG